MRAMAFSETCGVRLVTRRIIVMILLCAGENAIRHDIMILRYMGGGLFGLISYPTPKKNVSICEDLIKKKIKQELHLISDAAAASLSSR